VAVEKGDGRGVRVWGVCLVRWEGDEMLVVEASVVKAGAGMRWGGERWRVLL
jgi:hypothetical protein